MLFNGFTLDAIKVAFEKVEDKTDWKNPIQALVPVDQLLITIIAIEHYTAAGVQVRTGTTEYSSDGNNGISMFWVESVGYRMGPAGP